MNIFSVSDFGNSNTECNPTAAGDLSRRVRNCMDIFSYFRVFQMSPFNIVILVLVMGFISLAG